MNLDHPEEQTTKEAQNILKVIDEEYLINTLFKLLNIPSPTGLTKKIATFISRELTQMEIPFEVTNRGAISATIKGNQALHERAIVSHLDTIGAMVTQIKKNGRLKITNIGGWAARFAECARITIYSDDEKTFRGTVLPKKASVHACGIKEVNEFPVCWDNLEIRIDEITNSKADTEKFGINVGDFVAFDSNPEITNGFINARHLDDKAGVAIVLTLIKAIKKLNILIPTDLHLLFTVTEEVGSGASSILPPETSSMVLVDCSVVAKKQNSSERGITIAMKDERGPYSHNLTRKLIELCKKHNLPHKRDVFNRYSSDAASALAAGNDIQTALLGFGADAPHSLERTHIDSLVALTRLLILYVQSPR